MALAEKIKPKDLAGILSIVPRLVKFPARRMWIDYDAEADVLYLSFRRPQKATESELHNDGIIVRRRGKQIVGLTILDASTR
jgi:uncharacterized protein YuzE